MPGLRYLALLPVLIAGCVVRPVYYQTEYPGCTVKARKVSLQWQPEYLIRLDCRGAQSDQCLVSLLAINGVIISGSLLVSGSIYIVGNSVHWLEYQGRCPQSTLHQALYFTTGSRSNAGLQTRL